MKHLDLNEIRVELDKIDTELVELIARRMSFMPDIAQYKIDNNMELFQPEREEEVILSKREIAEKFDVNCDLVEEIFRLLMDNAKKIQQEVVEDK